MSHTSPLVHADWLHTHLQDVRLCDVRWPPAGAQGLARYREGHIPGAVFVDLDADLSAELSPDGAGGRHPWPAVEAFSQTLGRLGISADTHVVAYDATAGSIAARLWFMLRVHGHEKVSVLDGGLPAWSAAGFPLQRQDVTPQPVEPPRLKLDKARLIHTAEELQRERGNATLLDARAPERYRGETEPIDKKAGHIPGAVNMPHLQNLIDGRFKPPAELRALYEKLGGEVISSCGSGVTACHDLLALELAGLNPGKLYVGSWSDWISDPSRPIGSGA